MVAELHNPDPAAPPDPAAIPRLKPLAPEDARLLNAFLFTHNQDHSAAAAAFNVQEVELMLFLDQPHITPYLQRFAANRRDQRTDRAAAKLDELINRTTNDIELRRAITTLFRFYQPPRVTRPRAIKTGADNPPPPPAPDVDPDGLRARSNTTTTDHPKANPAAPDAAGPQTAASPKRDHSSGDHTTTRPRDHSPDDHAIIEDLTPLMPTDPDELTVWINHVSAKRYRWTRADQRAFRASIKAAREAAHTHARGQGIDLSTNPDLAALYIAGFITRLCDPKPTPARPP